MLYTIRTMIRLLWGQGPLRTDRSSCQTYTREDSLRGVPIRVVLLGPCLGAVTVCGLVLLAWSIREASRAPDDTFVWMALVVALAAVVVGRIPVKLGVGDTITTLENVPLVLGALLLPVHVVVVIATVVTVIALVGQPVLPGIRGRLLQCSCVAGSGLALGAAASVATMLVPDDVTMLRLVPAFAVALLLELCFAALFLLDIGLTEPELIPEWVRGWPAPAVTTILPAVAAVLLVPYSDAPLAFVVLLAITLAVMYGALWLANSQQLEKRRGQRLQDTFSRYVPEGVVDANLDSMQQIELGGEQREITVLFCDIRGFTSWAEEREPTEVVTQLNELLGELSDAVMAEGGTLDKYTGDGLMAFWGAPVPSADHADRAARAAIDMVGRLDEVNRSRMRAGHEPFSIGVGVHTGPAVVGNIGSVRRLDYTAIGDTVNTSARIEAATKDVGAMLLVSTATVQRLHNTIRSGATHMGEVKVKGRAKPVAVWTLAPMVERRLELPGEDDLFLPVAV